MHSFALRYDCISMPVRISTMAIVPMLVIFHAATPLLFVAFRRGIMWYMMYAIVLALEVLHRLVIRLDRPLY